MNERETAIDKIASVYTISQKMPFWCRHGFHIMKGVGEVKGEYTKFYVCSLCGLIQENYWDEGEPWERPKWVKYYRGFLNSNKNLKEISANDLKEFLVAYQNLPVLNWFCFNMHGTNITHDKFASLLTHEKENKQ
jgi:hypothetical protein